MGKKIGRNAPCPCGSTKKYKHCCLSREEALSPYCVEQDMRQHFDRKYCLHPAAGDACSGRIVRAHTIQRNGGLSTIARRGHVIQIRPSLGAGGFVPEELGLKAASTFNGFCNGHDTSTFRDLETRPFVGDSRQCFLVGYRALALEVHRKRAQCEHARDLLAAPIEQERSEFFGAFLAECENARPNLERHFSAYAPGLSGELDGFAHRMYMMDRQPEVLSTFCIFPEYDFAGELLQDLEQLRDDQDLIAFALIPTDSGGAAVFSWARSTEIRGTCEELVSSFDRLPDPDKPEALVRFCYEYGENTFASPAWWDALDESRREELVRMAGHAAEHDPRCLCPTGVPFVDWKISKVAQG